MWKVRSSDEAPGAVSVGDEHPYDDQIVATAELLGRETIAYSCAQVARRRQDRIAALERENEELREACAAQKGDSVALYNFAVLLKGDNATVDAYLNANREARAAAKRGDRA